MKKIFILIPAFLGLLLLSCNGASDRRATDGEENNREHKEEHAEEHAHENPPTTTLTPEQIASIGILTGSIEEKQLTASLKANGTLQVPNQNKAAISSVYSGTIRSILVQPGNIVSKGQVIATIANPGFIKVQEEYLSVVSRTGLAVQEYERQKELNEGNAGALKNLQAAGTELNTLRTRQRALEEQLRLMGIDPARLTAGKLVSVLSVRSPIKGAVSNIPVKIGSYVDATTVIADIVDNSQLHLDLYVYEKDLHKLRNNQTIHFTVTNDPGKEYDAEIFSLGSSFEGESKAVSVHARVKGDKSGLIDGMNITAIVSLEKATVPAVPSEAIVSYQGQDYIFIVRDEHTDKEHAHGEMEAHKDEDEPDAQRGNEAEHAHNPNDAEHPDNDAHKHKPNDAKRRNDNKHMHQEEKQPGAVPVKEITFERIPVAKGTTDIGYTEITPLKEIPPHARIVVKGAFFVLARMTNTGEEGHAH